MALTGRNQIRCVSVERDGRQSALAAALVSSGVPDSLSLMVAAGSVQLLRMHVFNTLCDVIGSGDDVEDVCGWKGPTRSLAGTLAQHGYLVDVNGVYAFVDAVRHAPEFVTKRWKRNARDNYDAAVSRSMAPQYHKKDNNIVKAKAEPEPEPVKVVATASNTDLFGQPLATGEANVTAPRRQADTRGASPGHTEFVQWWEERWSKCERGRKWVWQPKHFAAIKRLIAAAGDYQSLCNWAENFLRNSEPFYRGHDLCIFLAHVNKFTTAAAVRGIQAGGDVRPVGYDPNRIERAAVTGSVGGIGE